MAEFAIAQVDRAISRCESRSLPDLQSFSGVNVPRPVSCSLPDVVKTIR